MADKTILIVEDDRTLRDILVYNLQKEGYRTVQAADGTGALESARREKPDLILLDLMLPQLSGFEVCRILRQETTIPILILTARADEVDKVVGLELGADDYMTKPFSMRELLARIRAMLRRADMLKQPIGEKATASPTILRAGQIEVDISRHMVTRDGIVLELKPKEFDLLVFLIQNRGRVFPRDTLLERVWGYDYAGDTRTVDVHIRWLRQKIEADPDHPVRIITVRGVGYKFEE
ncbi:MAG: response regulator transcription factor [Dehalococcoidales bacterium]|nr:response regulator transcription factor [Dehalococcoidales bacterium]